MRAAAARDDDRAPREAASPAARGAAALADQIGLKLRFAQAAVWSDLIATFRPFAMRPQHYAALSVIADHPGCKQQEIGASLRISPSNLVALVDELAAAGLIDRREAPGDRRSNALTLADAGVALLARMNEAHAAHERRLAAVLDRDERAALLAALTKLADL